MAIFLCSESKENKDGSEDKQGDTRLPGSIFFGLNLRQLVFAALAIIVTVGIYFGLRNVNVLGTETVSWLCILGAFPFGALGFVKYNGMTAEQFIAAWVKSELLTPKKLVFRAANIYYTMICPKD